MANYQKRLPTWRVEFEANGVNDIIEVHAETAKQARDAVYDSLRDDGHNFPWVGKPERVGFTGEEDE